MKLLRSGFRTYITNFVKISIDGLDFKASDPRSIAIPMQFDGDQPNAFGVDRAVSLACEAGSLVGDTRRGGSCNFEQVTFIPHCNGTHTECVGHITDERISVIDCLRDPFSIAAIISVSPETAIGAAENYAVTPDANDPLITRRVVEAALSSISPDNREKLTALIIRTLPNDHSKLSRIYRDEIPPYFSTEAMEFIVASGIEHLLVDLPSIDRIYDEGKLSNHRIFWNVGKESRSVRPESRLDATVTELIYVPRDINDGICLLNLQIAPFASDAAPSNPVVFTILAR